MSRVADRRGGHDVRKHATSSARPQLNEYWISGEKINRQVLQTEICKYLGAEATCRPGEYQGVAGYKIKAMRPFTPDMLDDLRAASAAFLSENRAYMRRHDRELAYNDSQTYESQTNGMDYDQTTPFPGRDSPAYTSSSQAFGGPVSSAPGYPSSSAGYGASSYATHPGIPSSSAGPNGYGQDHSAYSHAPRDPRDVMREAPQYGNSYQNHNQAGYHASSGPQYGDAYGGQRGDQRGDTRMGYDNYGGGSSGPPPRRQEPAHFESMQGMSGPGAGYGGPPPGRNGAPLYNDQGYDPYSRGGAPDPRFGGRR